MFFEYPAVHETATSGDVYADYVNHCRRHREMNVADSKVSTAHECTHGIHSEIRLMRGVAYDIVVPASAHESSGDGTHLWVPVTKMSTMRNVTGPKLNAFYVGRDRAIRLPEPPIRKRHAAQAVPAGLREYRYKLYMAGQQAWDDTPFYVWDEWVAYANGADCCLDLVRREKYNEGNRDFLLGVLEFNVYAAAVLMATQKQDSSWLKENPEVIAFFRWHWDRCWRLWFEGAPKFQWDSQNRYIECCLKSAVAAPVRDYLSSVDLLFPETLEDLDGKPDHMLL